MNRGKIGTMALIGYARVSSVQQNLDEQLEALKNYGCEKIFSGKHSGKAKENKEQLEKMLDYVREGDTVVVTKIDRLGRSLSQVLNVLEEFRKENIGFVAIQQGIDTTKKNDALSTAMIHLLGLFAELERSFIVERTQEGIRLKKERGEKCGGRPAALTDDKKKKLIDDIKKGSSLNELAFKYKVSKSTIQRIKEEIRKPLKEKYQLELSKFFDNEQEIRAIMANPVYYLKRCANYTDQEYVYLLIDLIENYAFQKLPMGYRTI